MRRLLCSNSVSWETQPGFGIVLRLEDRTKPPAGRKKLIRCTRPEAVGLTQLPLPPRLIARIVEQRVDGVQIAGLVAVVVLDEKKNSIIRAEVPIDPT